MVKDILPFFLGRYGQNEFLLFQPGIAGTREKRGDLLFVFGPVYGAGGIHQQPARPERRPCRA